MWRTRIWTRISRNLIGYPGRSFRSQEPVGSFMFLHVPCNRIPAGFSTDKFRRISCRFRLECTGTDRNSSVEKPAGIRLQGTWRNIKDPAGSDRVRATWVARNQLKSSFLESALPQAFYLGSSNLATICLKTHIDRLTTYENHHAQ